MISDVRNAAIAVEVAALDARTYEGLAVNTVTGPGTAIWTIGAVTANSSLSRNNVPSVLGTPAPTATTYAIQITNAGARTDRTMVRIDQTGLITWHTAPTPMP